MNVKLSPIRTAIGLVIAGAVLLLLSASGQDGSFWEDGPEWLGTLGWVGFLVCVVLLLATGLYVLAGRMRHHDTTIPH